MSTEVTARDTDTGESDTATIEHNYILITDGRCELAHVQRHANGTHILTIKNAAGVS